MELLIYLVKFIFCLKNISSTREKHFCPKILMSKYIDQSISVYAPKEKRKKKCQKKKKKKKKEKRGGARERAGQHHPTHRKKKE